MTSHGHENPAKKVTSSSISEADYASLLSKFAEKADKRQPGVLTEFQKLSEKDMTALLIQVLKEREGMYSGMDPLRKRESLILEKTEWEQEERIAEGRCYYWDCNSPPKTPLMKCPCHIVGVQYCSTTCQQRDWEWGHKATCPKRMSKAPAPKRTTNATSTSSINSTSNPPVKPSTKDAPKGSKTPSQEPPALKNQPRTFYDHLTGTTFIGAMYVAGMPAKI